MDYYICCTCHYTGVLCNTCLALLKAADKPGDSI
jgi:hypothetical protein